MIDYNTRRNKAQNQHLKHMIHHIDKKVGEQTTGFILALICQSLDDLSRDGDKEIRNMEIGFNNNFYSTKYDFESETGEMGEYHSKYETLKSFIEKEYEEARKAVEHALDIGDEEDDIRFNRLNDKYQFLRKIKEVMEGEKV